MRTRKQIGIFNVPMEGRIWAKCLHPTNLDFESKESRKTVTNNREKINPMSPSKESSRNKLETSKITRDLSLRPGGAIAYRTQANKTKCSEGKMAPHVSVCSHRENLGG